jgi:hypothetical protein
MTWIEVTDSRTQKPMWINLDYVRSMVDRPVGKNTGTFITYTSGDYISIGETKEEIRNRLGFPVRIVKREEPSDASAQSQGTASEAPGSPAG